MAENLGRNICEAKKWTACINAGQNIRTQVIKTNKNKLRSAQKPDEELQPEFTGETYIAKPGHIHKFCWPLIILVKGHKQKFTAMPKRKQTVTEFLEYHFNLYTFLKTLFGTDNDAAFDSREFRNSARKLK